jgi:hypothetical protein
MVINRVRVGVSAQMLFEAKHGHAVALGVSLRLLCYDDVLLHQT